MTFIPTGGILAAATTSLPEKIGGVRNWDYRFCWLRDATFALYALLDAGYQRGSEGLAGWLHRAVAGDPAATNIMYGLAGERRLPEMELDWLSGYENSKPVRIGNAASKQFQLDVYGEVVDAMYQSRRIGLEPEKSGWAVVTALTNYVVKASHEPDEGIWEVRGRAGISLILKSWPGSPWIAPLKGSKIIIWTGRSMSGGGAARNCIGRFATKVSTPSSDRSCSITARKISTPAC